MQRSHKRRIERHIEWRQREHHSKKHRVTKGRGGDTAERTKGTEGDTEKGERQRANVKQKKTQRREARGRD